MAEFFERRILHYERLADAPRQNECDPAIADLLVSAHMRDQPIRGYARQPDRREPRWQAHLVEVRPHPLCFLCSDETQTRSEVEGQDHAEPDRLAMQQLRTEPGLGLQSVPERMTEIQQG